MNQNMILPYNMRSKDADGLAHSKDPDQTGQSDLGLLCLRRLAVQKHWIIMVSVISQVLNAISTCIFIPSS